MLYPHWAHTLTNKILYAARGACATTPNNDRAGGGVRGGFGVKEVWMVLGGGGWVT